MTKKLLNYVFEYNHTNRDDINLEKERERIAKLI